MKKMRKFMGILLAMVMVVAMCVPAFAAQKATGEVNVQFYVPAGYTDSNGDYQETHHDGYVESGEVYDPYGGENVTLYKSAGTVDLSKIAESSVPLPEGFHGLYNYDSSINPEFPIFS